MNSTNSSKLKVLFEFQKSVRGVLLPVDVNYLKLVTYVKAKYDITDKDISLHYISGSNKIEVCDDDDIALFVNEICHKHTMVQTIYIKRVEQTLEVKPSSSSKPLDIDLNVSLFPEECDYQTPKVENHDNDFRSEQVFDDLQPCWQKSTFENMPDPPNSPDPIIKMINTLRHALVSKVKLGVWFDDKAACFYAIGIKALVERFEFKVIRSNKSRFSVNCVEKGCKWYVHTRKSIITCRFYVSSINDVHTCSRARINPNHRNATQKLLGRLLVDKLKDSRRIYTCKDIQKDLNIEWKIDVSYKRAWGGKNIALQLVNGSPTDSFEQLPYYCYNLKLENEGTVTHIETDDEDRFKMVFIGFGVAAALESDLPLEVYSLDLGSNRMRSGQLKSVVFRYFPRSENELIILKLILACSPLLKIVFIKLSNLSNDESENLKMNWELARKLLKLHRVSRTALVEFF